ncbi:MAG: glutamine--fructose-6-phosphate transaminase (isomerizing) [Betaproteobacteria bacterium]|jgi:glucosamine--fructose-6-phosphate aminotransferase (isomerizing)|nr:glutamine--fructose-6-phosphate transaminase (isomerizing) [Betaproteobacteria bacterium]
MCGIVGAAAGRDIVPVLVEGLRRLEYRGYDSAGIAVLNGAAHPALERVRAAGRVAELADRIRAQSVHSGTGIAHTRWATHGAPTEANAHPHVSGALAVVHNGIIENHAALRARLKEAGFVFKSETDTEVIGHLVSHHRAASEDLLEAAVKAVAELEGAFAIALVSADDPGTVVVARKGAPLLLGLGDGENFAASDVSALVQVTRRVVYLEDGDCAEIRSDRVRIVDSAGRPIERAVHLSDVNADAVDLGPYRHYMQKEIFEQPGALANTLEIVGGVASLQPGLFGAEAEALLRDAPLVQIVACGTSFHAGLVAAYWIESLARIPVRVDIASEFRYRDVAIDPRALVVTISQSGETADTLAAIEYAKSLGCDRTLTICNVPESSLLRASRLRFLTRAGPEIGVASTKAFTTQLSALYLLALVLAGLKGKLSVDEQKRQLGALRHLPAALQHVLSVEDAVARWAKRFAVKQHALFLGRGVHYPIAMEGALKLKEISYIHAEAYAAGELKHGPLALVDREMPVVAVAPGDALLEKLKSNLQEVRARGGELFVFADKNSGIEPSEGVNVITLSDHAGPLSPILHVVPLQLLAYHAALARGTDVDKPRNLAKSVTVE